jgi:hypothetical protein
MTIVNNTDLLPTALLVNSLFAYVIQRTLDCLSRARSGLIYFNQIALVNKVRPCSLSLLPYTTSSPLTFLKTISGKNSKGITV